MIQVCVIYNIVRIGQHGQKDHLVVDYGIFQGQTSRSEHTTMVSQLFVQQLGMADWSEDWYDWSCRTEQTTADFSCVNDAMNVGEKYYRDRWKFQRFKEKPVLLVKWDLSPVQGLGELEVVEWCRGLPSFLPSTLAFAHLEKCVLRLYGCVYCCVMVAWQNERKERLERERRQHALETAKAEACLVWLLAKQLVDEENVMQEELKRKKERIRQKLAIASTFGSALHGDRSLFVDWSKFAFV